MPVRAVRGQVDPDGWVFVTDTEVSLGPVPPEESQLRTYPGITLRDRGDHANVPVGSIVETAMGRHYRVEGHAAEGHRGTINVVASAEVQRGPQDVLAERFRQEYPATPEEAFASDPGPDIELDMARGSIWDVDEAAMAMPAPTRSSHRFFDSLLRHAPREAIKRVFFKADMSDPEDRIVQKRKRVPEDMANLVSSLVDNGDPYTAMHAPVLDIDFPCRLVESTTPGHFHLYIDKAMTWERYALLLNALWRSGIIEEGFYKMSMKREATFVRKPGVVKEEGDISSSEDVPEGPMQEEVQF